MADRQGIDGEWYARRDGVVRGPFTVLLVTRYILLGRIRLDDELSEDRVSWQPAKSITELLPDEIRTLTSWTDYQQLVVARLQADERRQERRVSRPDINQPPTDERRSGQDRRSNDAAHTIARHVFASNHDNSDKKRPHRTGALVATLLLAALAVVWLLPVSG
jgi:hypothetical protein